MLFNIQEFCNSIGISLFIYFFFPYLIVTTYNKDGGFEPLVYLGAKTPTN